MSPPHRREFLAGLKGGGNTAGTGRQDTPDRDPARVPLFSGQREKRLAKTRLIISLFDASGTWSDPYRRPGYAVEQIDLHLGRDALDYKPTRRPWAVIACPPCTIWTNANAHSWHKIPDDQFFLNFALIMHTLEIARSAEAWWVLENPRGRLAHILGPHQLEIQPWHYGDAHTKRTCLWGNFNPPARSPIIPLGSLVGGRRTIRHYPLFDATTTNIDHAIPLPTSFRNHLAPYHSERARLRARTSPRFAKAFAEANP